MSIATLHRFMEVELELGAGVLVPREETELLGQAAVDILAGLPGSPKVIDMCCGSGNLALGVAHAMPQVSVWGSDLTDATVAVARRNVARLGLGDRVTILQGDLFESLRDLNLAGQIDLVIANPPYISTGRLEGQSAHLLASEPREAFDGGPYGLTIHQKLIAQAPMFLKPGGHLAFEFGAGQDRQVQALLTRTRAYDSIELINDATGVPRIAVARSIGS